MNAEPQREHAKHGVDKVSQNAPRKICVGEELPENTQARVRRRVQLHNAASQRNKTTAASDERRKHMRCGETTPVFGKITVGRNGAKYRNHTEHKDANSGC